MKNSLNILRKLSKLKVTLFVGKLATKLLWVTSTPKSGAEPQTRNSLDHTALGPKEPSKKWTWISPNMKTRNAIDFVLPATIGVPRCRRYWSVDLR
ncbi:hypothetical protein ANCDUO_04519 [Ancylostoma duodenale]|uniref:Uncharacterized protein n=1 Tax=Ancylostoma duodenale TaxID=51022 RepID=A0A0C2H6T2_9BILA|nr:hypothetical protein ANCDUO_04519 [Ancylostoma duodenale]